MYGCGLRFGEAINLIWDPTVVDFTNSRIIICDRAGTENTPSFFVKDYESRIIPMPQWVVNSIIELKEISQKDYNYLFISRECFERIKKSWKKMLKKGNSHKWQNRSMMWSALRQFKLYCKKAGIITNKKLNLHSLRKGYGTNLVNIGTPANTLKDLMGHSSIVTTMKFYVNSIDENKKKAVEGLDRLMEG